MNRRSFFGTLAGIPAAGALATAKPTVNQILDRGHDESTYRGWTIRWTRWKWRIGDECLVSQWMARCPKELFFYASSYGETPKRCTHVYSSSPGAVGHCWRGDAFNISVQEGQKLVTHSSDDGEKLLAKKETLQKLLGFIDSLHWQDKMIPL